MSIDFGATNKFFQIDKFANKDSANNEDRQSVPCSGIFVLMSIPLISLGYKTLNILWRNTCPHFQASNGSDSTPYRMDI